MTATAAVDDRPALASSAASPHAWSPTGATVGEQTKLAQ